MKKVLFLCRENSCRSQMAEGFAKRFGKDVMKVQSAGTEPAAEVNLMTAASMRERGIEVEDSSPRSIEELKGEKFDICVTFGCVEDDQLKSISVRERRDWGDIDDPKDGAYHDFRRVQMEIGSRVLALIKELRGNE